jgi:hypothetical protein
MTSLNLTASDRNALEFFEETASYVAGFGLTNLDRPERLLFKQGKQVAQRIADAARAAVKTRVPYSDEQTAFIADRYLATGGDRDAVVAAFLAVFPNSGHSADSIGQKFSRFRVLDRSCPGDTEWEVDQQVLRVARQYPEAFAA